MNRPNPRPAAAASVLHDDLLLVERARVGDPQAYDELFRRHRDRVARVAYLLLGDADQAQDAAQEAFLVGWQDLRRLREPERFRAWVTGIAVNLCRRRRRAAARASIAAATESEAPAASDEGEAAAIRVAVGRAVDALPRHMREVVVLRFYCEFAEAEIAEVLGIAAGTVKSRLGRARARLAGALQAVMEVES
ncbi:MAG TPA: sigma-70 family RNA polymerase sigma factor [Actinomycetota bacterium]|jgi:RNA polymerase sigma-70 factor (ECF subfamily)|nr:sigma-70 family RNA polymerase sigma factor [Actinomycetota bacterium]